MVTDVRKRLNKIELRINGKTYDEVEEGILCALRSVPACRNIDVDSYFGCDRYSSTELLRKEIGIWDADDELFYDACVVVVEYYCAETDEYCYSYEIEVFY